VRQACEALSADDDNQQKALLDRLVAMLTRLGQRGYAIREEVGKHRIGQFDTAADTDQLADAAQANNLFSLFLHLHSGQACPCGLIRKVQTGGSWQRRLVGSSLEDAQQPPASAPDISA